MKTINYASYIPLGFLLAGITMSSCNVEERRQLEQKAISLEQQLHEKDAAFNEIMDLMTKVESQIDLIKERENIIASRSNEDFPDSEKGQIVEDINTINDLIQKANEQVQNLTAKLNRANIEIGSFKAKINKLSQELNDRRIAMATLEEQLKERDNKITELSVEVESLVSTVNLQIETIKVQEDQLMAAGDEFNTAFYAVNTLKSLEEEGLVTRSGGFLWFGKTPELRADAAKSKFETVDIRNTTRFHVNSNKMNIVTEHPDDSYDVVLDEADKTIKYIDVTNPDEFWRVSKYLVVSVKG